MKPLLICLLAGASLLRGASGQIESKRAPANSVADADPNSDFWRAVKGVVAENDAHAVPDESRGPRSARSRMRRVPLLPSRRLGCSVEHINQPLFARMLDPEPNRVGFRRGCRFVN